MTQVKIERELVPIEWNFDSYYNRDRPTGRLKLVCVQDVKSWQYNQPAGNVEVTGLFGSELTALNEDMRFTLTLIGESPQPKAPDLLTQAATKAKAGDVKEAVRLAVEALQKMAEGEK